MDEIQSIEDWNIIFLSNLEPGGEYLELLPIANDLLDSIIEKNITNITDDDINVSILLKSTIPSSISKIINFGQIKYQDETEIILSYFQKIIEIFPKIQNNLNTEFINSMIQLFNQESPIFQQNKDLFYPMISNLFISKQDEIINTLKSMDLEGNIDVCYYMNLIISINQKIKQSKLQIKGIDRYTDLFKNLFFDFIYKNVSNPIFLSNKENIKIISQTFDLLFDSINQKDVIKHYQFFEENLVNENIEFQKFISHCLSSFCQKPKHSSIIISKESKTQKIIHFLLTKTFCPYVIKELKSFLYLLIGKGMFDLKFLIEFWNICSESLFFEKDDVYIDLIVYSLNFLKIDSIKEFTIFVQNKSSPYLYKLLSKIVFEFQYSCIEISNTYVVSLLNFTKTDGNAINELIKLVESKLIDSLSKSLIIELLPFLNNECNEFALFLMDLIINSSLDPSNLFDTDYIFSLINPNNDNQIIHILVQLSMKTNAILTNNLIDYLISKPNICDDTWNSLKQILLNNSYQKIKDINKILNIAKKQDLQNVSLSFAKFLKKLVIKYLYIDFIKTNKNCSVSDFHFPLRIYNNSIVALDLILNVYLYNNDQTVIAAVKKFLLKIFNRWNRNNSVNFLNSQLDFILQKEMENDELSRLLELILDFIESEVIIDPEDLNRPHFYPKKYLKLIIIIRYPVSSETRAIYFNQEKTLQNLKERISKLVNINNKFIYYEDNNDLEKSKTLIECGIKNNSEIKLYFKSLENNLQSKRKANIQTKNFDQNLPSFYFSQINFQDKLFNILDKNEFSINSIAWKILQLLPTSQSLLNYLKQTCNESNIKEEFNNIISETENYYKQLYLFQSFSRYKNMFANTDAINLLIKLCQEDYLKNDIIHILHTIYNEEEFQESIDITLILIEYINHAENDEVLLIIDLLIKISKNNINVIDFIMSSIEIFDNLNDKYANIIADLFYNIIGKSSSTNELIEYFDLKLKNDLGKSKKSLIIIKKTIDFINESQIDPIYQHIVKILSNYYDIFNEQKNISELLLISDILDCLSNIISNYPSLIQEDDFPIDFFLIMSFNSIFKEMQKSVLRILAVYVKTTRNHEIKDKIISIINEIIDNSHNNWNYDPFLNQRTELYAGIQNLGATCYANSVLQQIYHLFPVRYFISTNKCKSQNDLKSLQKLMIQMAYTKRPFVNLSEFISEWKGWKGNYLNPKEQQDSAEFFHYLIDSLPIKIKDLFKGEIISYINEDVSINESFYYISIPVKGYKDIYSSFDDYIYKKDNEIILSKFSQLPPIFVIQLDRFEYIKKCNAINKINDNFEFPIELNIEKMFIKKNEQNQCIYSLNGVILHKGGANSGHYISLIRKENDFLCFNDEKVTRISNNDAFQLSSGIKEFGTSAYILFYTRNSENIKIKKQKTITFNDEFDYSMEINNNYLMQIYKDNEIYEQNQMINEKHVIDFIQMIENPLLNIVFFFKILCRSINYSQSDIFVRNMKKIIVEEFNSIDSSSAFLECVDYLINNSNDIINCFLNCTDSFLISNLSNFILFFFNYFDSIMSLPENTILIDDISDFSINSQSHEKSFIFFNKIGDQVIKLTNPINKNLEIINLIISYISNHCQEALINGWTERLMKIIDNIYGRKIALNQIDLTSLDLSNILNSLNSLISESYDPDSNIINNLLKYGDEIKLSKKNNDPYENLIIESIIPSVNLIIENDKYSDLEKISSSEYLSLITSLNISNSILQMPNYSLLVYPKQKELLIFVAKHDIHSCKILLKANVSPFKKWSVESYDEQTSIKEINHPEKNLYAYCVTIPEIGEILVAENGNVLISNIITRVSFFVRTPDIVIINSGDISDLFIDSHNIVVTNEDDIQAKIFSLSIINNENESKLIISDKSILNVGILNINDVFIVNYGSLFINDNYTFKNSCSILNNGRIITGSLNSVKFLLNTSLGTIEYEDILTIFAVNFYNFGQIKSKSLIMIIDSFFSNYENIFVTDVFRLYSESIENYEKIGAKYAYFMGNNFRQYPYGCICANNTKFLNNKIELEGKLMITNISLINNSDTNSKKRNNMTVFNDVILAKMNIIYINECCEVLFSEKAKIGDITQITNEGELVIKAPISSIESIHNRSSGKLFIMNNINVKSINSDAHVKNKGHIIVLGKNSDKNGGFLYVGHNAPSDKYTLNINGPFYGTKDSTLEIANDGLIFASHFKSFGLTFCHHYLVIQNSETDDNFYGLVASQDGITFNSYDKLLHFSQNLIEPIIEGNEKKFKIINQNEIIIDDEFNKNVDIIIETTKFTNKSCLIANNIQINAHEFNNIRQISSSNGIDIKCTQFINNSGRIESHKNIVICAKETVENKGGGQIKKNVTENIKIYEETNTFFHVDEKTGAYTDIKLEEKTKTVTKDIYYPQLEKSGVITTDDGKLEIYAKNIDNSFGILNSKKGIFIKAYDSVINECGLMHSGYFLTINSKQFKNGYRPTSKEFKTFDPNKPIIIKRRVIQRIRKWPRRPRNERTRIIGFDYGEKMTKSNLSIKYENGIKNYEVCNYTVESSQYPGYLFAQNDINIYSQTDIFLGTIVSGKNIKIQGEKFSNINIKDRGTIIANGDVYFEMKKASLDQARIQAENIIIKLFEDLTIEGIIQPVILLDGSIILMLNLKKFAQIIGVFSQNPNMAQKLLDYTKVSLKKTNSSGFIGEHPDSKNFISSLPDEQMRDILNLILAPIHGRNIFQNKNLIQSLEYSGSIANNSTKTKYRKQNLSKIDKSMILYQKSDEKEVVINNNGEKQYVTVYDPHLIFCTLSKIVSFLDAQKKTSIKSMKNIKINPGNFKIDSDLSLEAGEKISMLSKYRYSSRGEKISIDQVNIQNGHELTISGEKGVETRAIKIDSNKINIISSNGDIKDELMPINFGYNKSGTKDIISELCAQDEVSMKAKNIELTGTNILAGHGGIEFSAENIDLKSSYKSFNNEKKEGKKTIKEKYKIVQPQRIETAGNIDFNAKNVNIASSYIFANLLKNNTNGNLNISALRDHLYYNVYYKKKNFFGSCSIDNTEIVDAVRPAEIVVKEIQSLGTGTIKIESAIIKATNAFITKDVIENTLDDDYYSHVVLKRRGFFPPKIKIDPLKESYKSLKNLTGGNLISNAAGISSNLFQFQNHIKTLSKLSSLTNPVVDLSAILLSRYATSAIYCNLKQTTDVKTKTPVQSQIKLGLLRFNNKRTHLEGIWDIDKASIETEKFTTASPKQTKDINIKHKNWCISFSPAGILTSLFYPCSLVSTIIPSVNITKYKESTKQINNIPMVLKANDLMIRCNDAIFSGSQIRAKIVDAVVNGKLTIESLTNLFEKKTKNTNIAIGISSLCKSVSSENIPISFFDKLQKFPSIQIANRQILSKKVDALAHLIGTEYFYLKVTELFYTKPSLCRLINEGVLTNNPSLIKDLSQKEIMEIGKNKCQNIQEIYQDKNKIINPSIYEIANLMNQIDNNKRARSNAIKEAILKGINSEEISKIDKGIIDFLNDEENIECIQEMNENIQKLNESINTISGILYSYSDEKSMPNEVSNEYHSTSKLIEKQMHASLSFASLMRQKHEKFLDEYSNTKDIYQNSISSMTNCILDGLVTIPIINCKESLAKHQQKFSSVCQSKSTKCSLIEEFPEKIVECAISYANNEEEAKEFTNTILYGLNNITKKSNDISFNIKNPGLFIDRLSKLEENVKNNVPDIFYHKENLRRESLQSMSQFLDQEVSNRIKYFPS